jgi:hypothetical protein
VDGALGLNLGAKGFDGLFITISKDLDLLNSTVFYIMGLKHPDSIGHGYAHQDVSVTHVMHLGTSYLDFNLHVLHDMCWQDYLAIAASFPELIPMLRLGLFLTGVVRLAFLRPG